VISVFVQHPHARLPQVQVVLNAERVYLLLTVHWCAVMTFVVQVVLDTERAAAAGALHAHPATEQAITWVLAAQLATRIAAYKVCYGNAWCSRG
jgi:hypothetical protein